MYIHDSFDNSKYISNLLNLKKNNNNNQEILKNKNNEIDNLKLIEMITNLKITQTIVEQNVYDDLEIFKGIENNDNSIFNVVNKCITIFGQNYFKNILDNPINDIEILKKRQTIHGTMSNNY